MKIILRRINQTKLKVWTVDDSSLPVVSQPMHSLCWLAGSESW